MFKKFDNYDGVCFFNGLIFYAPVALLIRTQAGVSNATFFMLQALLSLTVFVGEIPTGFITDKIGYKKSIISQVYTLPKPKKSEKLISLFNFINHSTKTRYVDFNHIWLIMSCKTHSLYFLRRMVF